jgi:MFS transporter, DHA3 family, macrolide efflux protein
LNSDDASVTADPSGSRAAAWLRAWPYWPAVSHPALRRLLPGYALSALGDGMSVVAIAWLALRLAPPQRQGLWVGAAVAAYTLPGAVGSVALGRWLRGRRGVRLAGADAALRALALGTIPVLAAAHGLGPLSYVGLLGASSLLHAWGMAGQYALIAEILPQRHRIAGNALLGIMAEITLIGGPALAGLLTALTGPATVIAADAATFAVLAVSYAWVAPLVPRSGPAATGAGGGEAAPGGERQPGQDGDREAARDGDREAARDGDHAAQNGKRPAIRSGWSIIRANRTLLGLQLLTFVFYALYGPVEVALPVHVSADLHGSAALLGLFWASYAVGAVLGSLTAPYLRRWPVWPTMIGIVAGWGLALTPLGLGAPLGISFGCFAVGGVIYAPYTSISIAVFQDASPAGTLAPVLASRAALVVVSTPLGIALGGPLVAALGARGTLLASALATMALAAVALAVLAATGTAARRHSGRRHSG